LSEAQIEDSTADLEQVLDDIFSYSCVSNWRTVSVDVYAKLVVLLYYNIREDTPEALKAWVSIGVSAIMLADKVQANEHVCKVDLVNLLIKNSISVLLDDSAEFLVKLSKFSRIIFLAHHKRIICLIFVEESLVKFTFVFILLVDHDESVG
jgi:hypothetical protein